MADNKKRRMTSLAFLALGLALAILSAAYWMLASPGSQQWAITGCVTGIIMALAGAGGALGTRRPHDERTRKLSAYAASWSWFTAVVVTSSMYLLDFYGGVKTETTQALAIVLATLLVTMIAFNAYFKLRGDVE